MYELVRISPLLSRVIPSLYGCTKWVFLSRVTRLYESIKMLQYVFLHAYRVFSGVPILTRQLSSLLAMIRLLRKPSWTHTSSMCKAASHFSQSFDFIASLNVGSSPLSLCLELDSRSHDLEYLVWTGFAWIWAFAVSECVFGRCFARLDVLSRL